MCKLLVAAIDKAGIKRGDVIAVINDHEYEGNVPRQSSRWRIVSIPELDYRHPSIQKLMMKDDLGSTVAPFRRFYIDLDKLEEYAFIRTGQIGSSDMAIKTGLMQVESFTKVRFIPHTNMVIG